MVCIRSILLALTLTVCLTEGAGPAGVRGRPREGRKGRVRKPRPTPATAPSRGTSSGGTLIHTVHNEDLDSVLNKNVLSSVKRLVSDKSDKKPVKPKKVRRKIVFNDNMEQFKKIPKSEEQTVKEDQTKAEKVVSRQQDAKNGFFENDITADEPHTDQSMDCDTVMRDPKDQMTSGTKDMMCDMYKQWGSGMNKPHDWHPTHGQRSWFDSLGMAAKSNPTPVTSPEEDTQSYHGDQHPEEGADRERYETEGPYHGLLPPQPKYDRDDVSYRGHSPDRSYRGHSPNEGSYRGHSPDNLGYEGSNAFGYERSHPPYPPYDLYKPRDGYDPRPHRHRRQSGSGRAIRKEYRSLSDDERHRFHTAVRELKNSRMDGKRKYDVFVGYHQANMAPGGHFGPAFLPWHRELLFRWVE